MDGAAFWTNATPYPAPPALLAHLRTQGPGGSDASDAGDADKDGRISLLEAFTAARAEVARMYERRNLLATEQAQLTDSALARTVAFGVATAPADPKIAALWNERRALEAQVDALRRKKSQMASTAYTRELERLLLEIAEKTAAIRAAEAKP